MKKQPQKNEPSPSRHNHPNNHDIPSQKIKFQSDDSQGSDISYQSSIQSDDDMQLGRVEYFKQEMARFFINYPQLINEDLIQRNKLDNLEEEKEVFNANINGNGKKAMNSGMGQTQNNSNLQNGTSHNQPQNAAQMMFANFENKNQRTKMQNVSTNSKTSNKASRIPLKIPQNQPNYWSPIALQVLREAKQASTSLQSLAKRVTVYRNKVQQPDLIDLLIKQQSTILKQIQQEINIRKFQSADCRINHHSHHTTNNNNNNSTGNHRYHLHQRTSSTDKQNTGNYGGDTVYYSWKKRRQMEMKKSGGVSSGSLHLHNNHHHGSQNNNSSNRGRSKPQSYSNSKNYQNHNNGSQHYGNQTPRKIASYSQNHSQKSMKASIPNYQRPSPRHANNNNSHHSQSQPHYSQNQTSLRKNNHFQQQKVLKHKGNQQLNQPNIITKYVDSPNHNSKNPNLNRNLLHQPTSPQPHQRHQNQNQKQKQHSLTKKSKQQSNSGTSTPAGNQSNNNNNNNPIQSSSNIPPPNKHILNFNPKTQAGKQLLQEIKRFNPNDQLHIKKAIINFLVKHRQNLQKQIISKSTLSQKINKLYNQDSKELIMFYPIKNKDTGNTNTNNGNSTSNNVSGMGTATITPTSSITTNNNNTITGIGMGGGTASNQTGFISGNINKNNNIQFSAINNHTSSQVFNPNATGSDANISNNNVNNNNNTTNNNLRTDNIKEKGDRNSGMNGGNNNNNNNNTSTGNGVTNTNTNTAFITNGIVENTSMGVSLPVNGVGGGGSNNNNQNGNGNSNSGNNSANGNFSSSFTGNQVTNGYSQVDSLLKVLKQISEGPLMKYWKLLQQKKL